MNGQLVLYYYLYWLQEVHRPEELVRRELVAFSYYYDRAVEAAIIPPTGGRVRVQDYTQVRYIHIEGIQIFYVSLWLLQYESFFLLWLFALIIQILRQKKNASSLLRYSPNR